MAQLDAQLNEPDTQNRLSALTAYNLSRALCTIRSLETENAALKARAEKAEADLKSALDHINQQSFKILGLEMELKEKTYDD